MRVVGYARAEGSQQLLGKRAAILSVTVVVMLAASSAPVAATQYSPPYAEVFSFWYPNDSVGKNLPTKASGDAAVLRLNATGYQGFDDMNNVSAAGSMGSSYAKSDAVWVFFGHGRAGAELFWKASTSSYSELLADGGVSVLNSSWGSATLGVTTGLSDIRLMVFGSCNSADSAGGGFFWNGNLQNNAFGLGVDSTIAFTDLIYWPGVDFWADEFFRSLQVGRTVDQAAVSAAGYVTYALGVGALGTDKYKTTGGAKKTVPVGYGTP